MDFFSSFLRVRPQRDFLDLLAYVQNSILEKENDCLLQLPLIQEVKDAIFSISIDSSLGPDGLALNSIEHVGRLLKMMWLLQLGTCLVGF